MLHWRYELPCQDKLPEFHYTPIVGCIRDFWLALHPLGLELDKALLGWNSVTVICCNGKVPFFDCAALHYLCRPIQLESINVFEFYGNYQIINKTRKNESELLELINDKFSILHLIEQR